MPTPTMGQNQVKSEKESQEAAPILMDSVNQKPVPVESPYPLHRAAYFRNIDKVKELLESGFPGSTEPMTRMLNNGKKTPLHLAAAAVSAEICTLLIETDKNHPLSTGKEPLVNIQDGNGQTALHLAAQQPTLVTLLLRFGADPNIKDVDGCTALHLCAEGNTEASIAAAHILLTTPGMIAYEPCGPSKGQRNVMHIAANRMSWRMLEFLLSERFDHSRKDGKGNTPLMLAACAGDSEVAVKCVESLLEASTGEDINATSDENGQTAVMMAAYRSHHKVLKALMGNSMTDVFVTDSQERTALHWAVDAWFRSNSLDCVKLLVESDKVSGEWSNQSYLYGNKDSKGESPIDIAIKHHSIRITEYLITAHPTPESWLTDEMMMKIYQQLPEAMIPLMNKSLMYNPAKFHERNEVINVEFGTITGFSDPVVEDPKQETKFLHHILYAPKEIQRAVFLHPLVQIFLDLKWTNVRWLTWIAILFQFLWTVVYTFMIFEIYIPNCAGESNETSTHSSSAEIGGGSDEKKVKTLKLLLSLGFVHRENSDLEDCDFNHGAAQGFAVVLYFLSAVIIMKECFQMKQNWRNYIFDFTNYMQIGILLLSFINSSPAWQSSSNVDKWQAHLAAIGIFIAWVLTLREVGKFPKCGIYAAILKKVFWHCLKMLVFYFPLLIAFALALRILVPGKGQYTYLFFAIVKVVIMMTGELDFEDAFYENDGPSLAVNAILGQLVFLLLVFITTIVLLNLLTGLAVNDVQSLMVEAEINRSCNELEQIYLLESLILWVRQNVIGLERWTDILYSLNVTTTKYPDYTMFTFLKEDVDTKRYSQDLKQRIRQNMVPVENNDNE